MKDSVVSNTVDEFSAVLVEPDQQAAASFEITSRVAVPARSYTPYPWPVLNQILDIVDTKTKGRAGVIQRFVSYLFFGGTAALVNLLVFYIMDAHILAAFTAQHAFVGRTLSYAVASELSILANFIPNDRFTFSKLPGAKRPWIQRCLRFQATCIVGSLLTYLIMMGLTSFLHVMPIIAEAIATLLVLIYNFTFHHLFTYAHKKH